jgi:hypothetical protein
MMDGTTARQLGVWLAAVVAGVILAASVIALLVDPATFDLHEAQFELVVTNTLFPFFEAILAGLVAATVGKALATALTRK